MTSKKMTTITGIVIHEEVTLTLAEICRATLADRELIMQLIEYHVIQPIGESESNWMFDYVCLKRVRLARNFYHDLEINLPGIALVIDMLERIDELESELARLK